MARIRISVFRDGSTWFASRSIDGEYDGCDEVGIDDTASESEAIEAAKSMPLNVEGERIVTKVDDVDTFGANHDGVSQ